MRSPGGVAGERCSVFIQQKAQFGCDSPGGRRGKGEAAGRINPHIWVAPTSPGPQLHPNQASSAGKTGQTVQQGREHLSRCTALSAG